MNLDLFPGESDSDYLSRQLIAYIGNKRRLLPFLRNVVSAEAESLKERGFSGTFRFLDPFAGSGAVSRLARSMGMSVMASDTEEYARVLNSAFLCLSPSALRSASATHGGVEALLARYNGLHPLRGGNAHPDEYFARHYAPARTDAPLIGSERLFYTHENALFLDSVRTALDDDYPLPADAAIGAPPEARIKCLLLALLLYEAATHANTSGVFKAYHKGFGGHSGEALYRIMAAMELESPVLIDGPPALVEREDAARFCKARSADICYLDPPYNQHQYGSNYHILNSLALNDRLPVSERRDANGQLLDKAGIPERWKETKSPYCSKAQCERAFKELFDSIDAPVIVVSYGEGGSLPLESLVELLSDRAEVEVRSTGYVAYRGGRQSDARSTASSEFALVARRIDGRAVRRDVAHRNLALAKRLAQLPALIDEVHRASELRKHFSIHGAQAVWREEGLVFSIIGNCMFARKDLSAVEKETLARLSKLLESTRCASHAEACEVLAYAIRDAEPSIGTARVLSMRFLRSLRKLAHRKYRTEFREACSSGRSVAPFLPDKQRKEFLDGITEIERLAQKRLVNH